MDNPANFIEKEQIEIGSGHIQKYFYLTNKNCEVAFFIGKQHLNALCVKLPQKG